MKASVAITAMLGVLALTSSAAADGKAAERAFRKGKKLLQQKRYQEACAAFEDSFREDPAIGAQLNVARCFQEWGKLVTAHEAFKEALKLARATDDDRAPQIKELVTELRKTLPILVVTMPSGAARQGDPGRSRAARGGGARSPRSAADDASQGSRRAAQLGGGTPRRHGRRPLEGGSRRKR
jgi:tetratricopeptide (TPR) repeat protein